MERIRRELVYEGTIIKVYKDHMKIKGNDAVWDYFELPGGAAIVPVLENGNVLLVKQYRNAMNEYVLELPAGKFDSKDESGEKCVRRELTEETGYIAREVIHLLTIRSLIAFSDERVEIFAATNLVQGQQKLDAEEEIELVEYSITKLKEMVFSGEIQDSKTVAGLLAYINKYEL